ncbi:acetyl-coA hydrolase [lymphocystis disease virus-China]|uniref:Acetyl-coA hydrolase n=2 Tax=Lymphocystis disease virus 2 TaxID=159183 RepID=A0A6F8X087_9VIRU|nr:acetyl-coA hydrolase [lymphocystis disease virus-China]AAU11005.1 acetyl-coA hydrolase [lymphocystis disease virus-China]BCB67508.1 acetyl-coA hydrolase [Lymphocystis disease virus 2]
MPTIDLYKNNLYPWKIIGPKFTPYYTYLTPKQEEQGFTKPIDLSLIERIYSHLFKTAHFKSRAFVHLDDKQAVLALKGQEDDAYFHKHKLKAMRIKIRSNPDLARLLNVTGPYTLIHPDRALIGLLTQERNAVIPVETEDAITPAELKRLFLALKELFFSDHKRLPPDGSSLSELKRAATPYYDKIKGYGLPAIPYYVLQHPKSMPGYVARLYATDVYQKQLYEFKIALIYAQCRALLKEYYDISENKYDFAIEQALSTEWSLSDLLNRIYYAYENELLEPEVLADVHAPKPDSELQFIETSGFMKDWQLMGNEELKMSVPRELWFETMGPSFTIDDISFPSCVHYAYFKVLQRMYPKFKTDQLIELPMIKLPYLYKEQAENWITQTLLTAVEEELSDILVRHPIIKIVLYGAQNYDLKWIDPTDQVLGNKLTNAYERVKNNIVLDFKGRFVDSLNMTENMFFTEWFKYRIKQYNTDVTLLGEWTAYYHNSVGVSAFRRASLAELNYLPDDNNIQWALIVNEYSTEFTGKSIFEAVSRALELWEDARMDAESAEATMLIYKNAQILHKAIQSQVDFNAFFNMLKTGKPDSSHRYDVFRIKTLMDVDFKLIAARLKKPLKTLLDI